MAVARSCLTLWVYRILVRLCFDPRNDRNQPQVGEGICVSRFWLVRVS